MICSLINKVQVVRWQERSTPVPYTCIKQCTSSELPLAVGHYIKAHKLGLLGPWWIVWSPRRLFFCQVSFYSCNWDWSVTRVTRAFSCKPCDWDWILFRDCQSARMEWKPVTCDGILLHLFSNQVLISPGGNVLSGCQWWSVLPTLGLAINP